MHVTDYDSIKDDNPLNDKLEDFTTYQANETYRYAIGLFANTRGYTTQYGGKVYFAEQVTVVEPEHRTLTNTDNLSYGLVYGYIYFTVSETEAGGIGGGPLIGDVNQDGSVDATDRMILSRYLAKWDGYAAKIKSMDAADIDRNGLVEAKDRMILARYLAKWTGYDQYFK